jgi:anti-anti-sigma factor
LNGAVAPGGVEPELLVAARRSGEAAEIFCIGSIDISSADTFRAQLDEVVSWGCDTVIVDFTLTDFMDSTGLAVLARASREIPNLGVRHVKESIRRMLLLSGINAVIDVIGDGEPAPG